MICWVSDGEKRKKRRRRRETVVLRLHNSDRCRPQRGGMEGGQRGSLGTEDKISKKLLEDAGEERWRESNYNNDDYDDEDNWLKTLR